MLNIKLDPRSDLSVKWPTKDVDIITLGTAYLAFEATVPAATGGESSRAVAAETLRQKYEIAKPQLEVAINQLKAKYYANLAQLEEWGFLVQARTTGGNGHGEPPPEEPPA